MRLEVIETEVDSSHRSYIVVVEDPARHVVDRWLKRTIKHITGSLIYTYRHEPEITEEKPFDHLGSIFVGRARFTVAI